MQYVSFLLYFLLDIVMPAYGRTGDLYVTLFMRQRTAGRRIETDMY